MKIQLKPGCEYYVNLLYPVVIQGQIFRATRVLQHNGNILDIPDHDLSLWKHYPLCRKCYYPDLALWQFCWDNTVSPCGKHYDYQCRPFTFQTLTQHLIFCHDIACRKMLHFLQARQPKVAPQLGLDFSHRMVVQ